MGKTEIMMVFKTCKCGKLVGCELSDRIEDGGLIDHAECSLAWSVNKEEKKE